MRYHPSIDFTNSKRRSSYTCPMCGRVERSRKLHRQHLLDAHAPQQVLTTGQRAALGNRNRKVKVTLP
jgi:uncharacterized C2H2 Zn-finger protein